MINKVYILHEYGDTNHYQALEYLCKKFNIQVKYYEFSIVKNFLKGLLKRDFSLIKKQLYNLKFLLNLFFSSNKKIVLGIAPYDYRLLFLKQILRKHKVYYHTSWVDWDGSFYPKKLFVNLYVKSVWKKFLENEVEYVFCVSKVTKESLLKNYDIKKNKLEVVYHSYDENIFKYKERDINRKFIFVGRLEKEKGIEELLEFFAKHKQFEFIVAGNGNLLKLVERYARTYTNIKYLGFLNKRELAKYYNRVTFLLLNSKKQDFWEELFGMVIIEAMACGVIPITTDHVGPKEIIRHKENGFIFKEDEYLNNLKDLISSLSIDFSKIRDNAISRARYFTKGNLSKKWEKILDE